MLVAESVSPELLGSVSEVEGEDDIEYGVCRQEICVGEAEEL